MECMERMAVDEENLYEELNYLYELNELNLKYLTDKRLFEMDSTFQWVEWI